ncbi:MAG: nucleoside kinase, partial [Alistipes sp.]|nr:nucleoside kinase [Alistipes sp.]
MQERVKVICQNTSTVLEVEMGSTLLDVLDQLPIEAPYPILAAYVNNSLRELNMRIFKPMTVRYIDITHFEGYRVYQRTITFILQKAMYDLYGNRKFHVRHSLGRGLYCEFADSEPTAEELKALRERMQQIIDARHTITRRRMLTAEINDIYE